MRNSTRRNRNIGTAKQGYGQHNQLTIPQPCVTSRTFFERLGNYEKFERRINGHDFLFGVEETRKGCEHACSVHAIVKIIEHIPTADLGELKLIILRQPKRKEAILSLVWGRLVYSYEFENDYFPAIILEAVDYTRQFKWPVRLSVDSQKELERLMADGHPIVQDKRAFVAEYKPEHVRSTQLYRTLIHEFGHYVHYLQVVEHPTVEDEPIEAWELRHEAYFRIPSVEKERFAHQYADSLRLKMMDDKVIPFNRT